MGSVLEVKLVLTPCEVGLSVIYFSLSKATTLPDLVTLRSDPVLGCHFLSLL